MYKLLEFDSFHDEFGQQLFLVDPDMSLSKQAAWRVKLADEVSAFCGSIEPHPDRRYVLSVALGAGETWGMNKNGDWFPRDSLSHDSRQKTAKRGHRGDYGHQTFLKAGRYRHHANKDPSKSMGKIVYAHWNPRMDRVELVSWIDANRAPDVVERIDRMQETGEKIATSMGCRVPYDRCSVCNHHAPTIRQYCQHLKTAMGKILPGGKAVYAINDYPNFFDDSIVILPAAPEAGITMKVAEVASQRQASAVLGLEIYGEDKQAGPKSGAIEKELPGSVEPELHKKIEEGRQVMNDLVPALDATEAPVKDACLRKLAELPVEQVLTTSAAMGILLKPEEFQKLALYSVGQSALADELAARGETLINLEHPEVLKEAESITPAPLLESNLNKEAADLFRPYLRGRSYWEPFYTERVSKLASLPLTRKFAAYKRRPQMKCAGAAEAVVPLSLGYWAYNLLSGSQDPKSIDALIRKHPMLSIPLAAAVAALAHGALGAGGGDRSTNPFPGAPLEVYNPDSSPFAARVPGVNEKTSSAGKFLTLYAGPGILPYVAKAEAIKKHRRGERVGTFGRLAASYPGTLSLGSVIGANLLAKKFKLASENGSATRIPGQPKEAAHQESVGYRARRLPTAVEGNVVQRLLRG